MASVPGSRGDPWRRKPWVNTRACSSIATETKTVGSPAMARDKFVLVSLYSRSWLFSPPLSGQRYRSTLEMLLLRLHRRTNQFRMLPWYGSRVHVGMLLPRRTICLLKHRALAAQSTAAIRFSGTEEYAGVRTSEASLENSESFFCSGVRIRPRVGITK